MLDGGEREVTGSAAVCVADLVYYAAVGERLVGLVKTRRLKYPPLAGADNPWGSRQAERCECRAMQKQQRAKAGMKLPRKRNMQTRMRFGAHEDARACCKDAVPGR